MGNNWHVRRDEPTIAELTASVAAGTKGLAEALKEHGADSLEYRNAEFWLRIETRKLDAAKHEDEKRKELENLTPKEIVDKIMSDR